MQSPKNLEILFSEAHNLELYSKLILQLNKDLRFANIDLEFDLETLPLSLKLMLNECVYDLINQRFSEYLNFLYIVDVPEKEIQSLQSNDTHKLSEDVTFLILKRVWQKVWYKSKFS